MSTAVVIGGGISGLSAAYYILRANTKFTKVILLEGSSRVGGWIQTTRHDNGAVFEQGPRSMRNSGEGGVVTLDMLSHLGLSQDIFPVPSSHPAARDRYIYVHGRVNKLPYGPLSLLKKQPPFSTAIIRHILAEPFRDRSPLVDDVTLHDFVSNRLGQEIAEYVIDPVCRGIFAGNSRELSLKSVFPAVYSLAEKSGSLVRGALRRKKEPAPDRLTPLSKTAQKEGWVLWTMRKGMAQIPEAIYRYLKTDPRFEIRLSEPCRGLQWMDTGAALVTTDSEEIRADHVFAALSARALAETLPSQDDELYTSIKSIQSVSVVTVNLEYDGHVMPFQYGGHGHFENGCICDREVTNHVDDDLKYFCIGFGHLLPSSEDECMLGVIYDSCTAKHHDRTGGQSTRFTCMFGGAWFDELLKRSEQAKMTVEDYCKREAVNSLRSQLGIESEPTHMIATLNKEAIPQYKVGHSETLARIHKYMTLRALPLTLLGSSYNGVSVVECIVNARRAVAGLSRP